LEYLSDNSLYKHLAGNGDTSYTELSKHKMIVSLSKDNNLMEFAVADDKVSDPEVQAIVAKSSMKQTMEENDSEQQQKRQKINHRGDY